MDGDAHAYTVRSDNGQVLLGAEGGEDGGARFDSLEQAAAQILIAELGIEVDHDMAEAFASEVLAPRMPEAHVSTDQLWRWIDT